MSARGQARSARQRRMPKRLQDAAVEAPAPKSRKSSIQVVQTERRSGPQAGGDEECSSGSGESDGEFWSAQGRTKGDATWSTHDGTMSGEATTSTASASAQEGQIAALLERIKALEEREIARKGIEKGQRVDELAITVAADMKEKILGGKCVDLSLLLAKSFLEKPEEKSVIFAQDSEGRLIAKEEKKSQAVLSIAQWTSAFHVYMSVYLKGHPEELQSMLSYIELIRGAAKEHEGRAWAKYDQMFRSRKEADPTRPWDMMDSQLWLQLFCRAAAPAQSYRAPEQTGSLKKLNQDHSACHYFNKARGCVRANCPYKHRCLHCGSRDHSVMTCKQRGRAANPHSATHAPQTSSKTVPSSQPRMQPFRFGSAPQ